MLRKKACIVIMSIVMAAIFTCQAAAAGWEHDRHKNYWYRLDNGDYYRSCIQNINGANYAFNSGGYMETGWINYGGSWLYFDPESGAQRTGWVEKDGKWYFLDEATGAMRTGWISSGGSWYYMEPGSGEMHVGWLDLNGDRYYLNNKGVLQTGTFQPDPGDSLRQYNFTADPATGKIIRNITVKDPKIEGRYISYDSEGKMSYTSNTSQEYSELTGEDDWRYIRQGERGKATTELEAAKLYETQLATDLAEMYYEARDEKEDDKAALKQYQKEWETRVKNSLSGQYSNDCIRKFIHDVEKDKFY